MVFVFQVVLGGINVLLIVLSVLQLCVSITCVVLGIKAVRKTFKKENQVQLGEGEQVLFRGGGGGGEPHIVSRRRRTRYS